MDETKALAIVSALANGVNPITAEIFPTDSPCQTADVVRALFLARRALEATSKTRSRAHLPGNAGKRWTQEEDQKLLSEFDRGCATPELAQAHSRTTAGIQARLEKHGRVQPQVSTASANRRAWRASDQRVDQRAET